MMDKTLNLLKSLRISFKSVVRQSTYPPYFSHLIRNDYPTTRYTHLSNGLKIATEESPDLTMACVGIYMDAGSRYETATNNGIAYLFQHIAFKGTKSRSKEEVEAQMNSMGAEFKCYTTRELVCYFVKCQAACVEQATELLLDCLINNALSKPEIDNQKKVVYAEMLRHDEDINGTLFDYLHTSTYQGTPLCKTVMGPSDNLYNFDGPILSQYQKRFLNPCAIVLAAVGCVKHEVIVKLGDRFLGQLYPSACKESEICRYTGSDVRYRNDSTSQASVIIAVEGPKFCHDDNIAMQIARHSLGSWDRSQLSSDFLSSRLAQIATKNHACEAFKSFNITYKDTGLWGIHYVGDVFKLDDMCIVTQCEWMYLCLGITDGEVERTKMFYKTKYLSKMQKVVATCHEVGRWTLYHGCRPGVLEVLAAIDSINAAKLRETCMRYLYDKCPTVAAIGAVDGLLDYNRIRSNMYWLRF